MSELTRVTNTQPRLLHLPPKAIKQPGNAPGEPETISLSQSVMLIPGGNNVPTEAWKAAKEHRVVKMWMEEGWLTEGGDTKEPEGPKSPSTLQSYGETGAIAIVDVENELKTLRKWERAERREAVKRAITERIQALTSDKEG